MEVVNDDLILLGERSGFLQLFMISTMSIINECYLNDNINSLCRTNTINEFCVEICVGWFGGIYFVVVANKDQI